MASEVRVVKDTRVELPRGMALVCEHCAGTLWDIEEDDGSIRCVLCSRTDTRYKGPKKVRKVTDLDRLYEDIEERADAAEGRETPLERGYEPERRGGWNRGLSNRERSITPEELRRLYVDERLSAWAIGHRIGRAGSTIEHWLKADGLHRGLR